MFLGCIEMRADLADPGQRLAPVADALARLRPGADVTLVLNEMPFGEWVADGSIFAPASAAAVVRDHDDALPALREIGAKHVLSTRAIDAAPLLANEAFSLTAEGYAARHHKQIFPQEEGWYEKSWFQSRRQGYSALDLDGTRFGFLVCSELMFPELARHYRAQETEVLVAPRAAGGNLQHWIVAAQMAALWSGCYVVSSNRRTQDGRFNGQGFIVGPDTTVLAVTSPEEPVALARFDREAVRANRDRYPCPLSDQAPNLRAAEAGASGR